MLVFFCWGCGQVTEQEQLGPPLFETLSSDQTNVQFANQLEESEDFNIIQYLYFYNGGGVAVGDINNDDLPDIYFTANQGENKLYLNQGNFKFEDITVSAGVGGQGDWTTGATMADVNGDGWLDIYVCQASGHGGLQGHNQLFINQQNGRFEERAADFRLDFKGLSTQAAFFDYDADGDLDMYLLNHSVHTADNYGKASQRYTRDERAGDRLYRNDNGLFTNVSETAGIYGSKIGYGLGIAIGDLNNDNCPDIYVSNDFHENDYLYYNNCDGTFTEGLTSSLGHTSTFSMGNDIADVNNDGLFDVLTLDMKPEQEAILKRSIGADPYNIYRYKLGFGYYYQYPRNMLHLNQGNLLGGQPVQFSEVAQLVGIASTDWSWTPLICDFDNDGWKDIFISNGIWRRPNDLDYLNFASNQQIQQSASDLEMAAKMPSGKIGNYFFRNLQDLQFANVSAAWGVDRSFACSNGAAYADLDQDGDQDLVINNLNEPASLLRNDSEGFHYLKIRLVGTEKNTFGIGARVKLWVDSLELTQELFLSKGFLSSTEPILHFGLGAASTVDTMEIRWPDGTLQRLYGLLADQFLRVEKSANAKAHLPPEAPLLFKNISESAGLYFRHRENRFVDFDREKLMPHMLSTQGPCLAVGDVNNDGLEDVYVGGATDQAGELFLQTSTARFERQEVNAFAMDRVHEDVDATFFDANGDGYLDLYVVSGGGEWTGEIKAMQDRLYLNNGAGRFTSAVGALPEFYTNGACVQALDYNQDGALDLFVGGRSIPGSYGLLPASYLLENDGSGRFENVSTDVLPDDGRLGMVTDVCLFNPQQLVIVGEWMPVTFLQFEKGICNRSTIAYSNGWWNCVEPSDVDADGDMDLVLGNLGQNAGIRASRNEPVELFVADFDNNGNTDPIIAHYRQGKRYSYSSFDELVMQVIALRKRFTSYRGFSEASFKQVFEATALRKAERYVAYTMSSSLVLNKGNDRYELQSLPKSAQVAPIFAVAPGDFNQNGKIDLLAVGNFFEAQPSFGRYDASYGFFLNGNNDGSFAIAPPKESGLIVPGQSRSIRVLNQNTKTPLVLVARNNERLLVFETTAHPKLDN